MRKAEKDVEVFACLPGRVRRRLRLQRRLRLLLQRQLRLSLQLLLRLQWRLRLQLLLRLSLLVVGVSGPVGLWVVVVPVRLVVVTLVTGVVRSSSVVAFPPAAI